MSSTDKKALTSPCTMCPFHRTSWRGYIGGHKHASEITDIVMNDEKFPCHLAVNHEVEENGLSFEGAVEEAPYCAGGLALMNNSLKLSRSPSVKELQKVVGRRDDVFKNAAEMVAYHHPPQQPAEMKLRRRKA